MTTTELAAMVGQSLNTLIDAIQTGKTERLTGYLAFSSRFHHYSRRNQQLIYEQCPEATRVASYVKWKEEGFQVRKLDKEKREKGISILVPKFPKGYQKSERRRPEYREGEKQEDEYKQNEIAFVAHNFRIGTVFDVTHLLPEDQKRVPELFTPIEGDHDSLYQQFVRVAQNDNIKVVETLDTDGARGGSGLGFILVRPDQPSGNKAAVIAHELAHELIHTEEKRRQLSRQVKECHAEATAFVVMSHFGITIPYSAEYLTMWGNTPDTLRGELDVVTAAASKIITKVHALNPDEKHLQDETEYR
ncbi:MAG TPA: ArdC family protein [Ktedonobacteraceae bacterium]|nr:ArdC family protein [Ktedonobacteraceae bacterium]